jgi:hypothetical protein
VICHPGIKKAVCFGHTAGNKGSDVVYPAVFDDPYICIILQAVLEMDYNDYCGSFNNYHTVRRINRKFTGYATHIWARKTHHNIQEMIWRLI